MSLSSSTDVYVHINIIDVHICIGATAQIIRIKYGLNWCPFFIELTAYQRNFPIVREKV